jgi:HEAT repeat protein
MGPLQQNDNKDKNVKIGIGSANSGDAKLSPQALPKPEAEPIASSATNLAEQLELLKSPDPNVRKETILALGRIGHTDKDDVIDALIDVHKNDEDITNRMYSAWMLGFIGKQFGERILSVLTETEKNESEEGHVRAAATKAIWELTDTRDKR